MKLLSRIEEIILLAVWRLQDEAYGISICEEVARATGETWQPGAIYGPLSRLHRKRLLKTTRGEPTPERGGRSKTYYHLTPHGRRALQQVRRINARIWSDIPVLEFDTP